MVDGVNFNPFTNKVFTAEEISHCDTDGNGVISNEELQANTSWLSTVAGVDDEGDVQIGSEEETQTTVLSDNEAKIYNAASKNGVQNSAADASTLQSYLNTVIDSYIEQYVQNNAGMEQNEKSQLIAFIKTQGQEFVNNYVQNNTAVPYDTQAAAQSLIQTLDGAIQNRKESSATVNSTINDYKNNVDANYEKLSATTNAADDDFVTTAEYQQMKEEAIAYLMGTLLNGAEDTEFLSGIDSNYKNNAYYKAAAEAVKAINNETDPEKIQQYLEQAKTALGNLIGTQNTDGTSKLNDTVISTDATKAETAKTAKQAEYTETLTSVVDTMVEQYSNQTRSSMFKNRLKYSADQVQQYQALLTNIMNKFVESYTGDGENIETEFKNYVSQVLQESSNAQSQLAEIGSTESSEKYGELKDAVNDVGTYVSAEEKQNIINVATDFVLNQLAQGIGDISILADIYPNYTMDTKFIEAQSLISGLATSATPLEDLEKAKQLITEMMETIGADAISEGVKNKKMPQITFTDAEMASLKSSVPGYDTNATISSETFKGNNRSDDARDDLQNKAKQTLENLKPQLLQMLKDKMGADYDEATANKLVDDAIYQTINDITDTMQISSKKKIFHRRRTTATISTQELVNTFMTNLLNNSAKASATTEEGQNPVDRESVMRNTELADAYQDKSQTKHYGSEVAKAQAKSQLQIISAQLKAQLMSELGSKYDSTQINSLVDQAISNTVESLTSTTERYGIFNLRKREIWTVNTNSIANKFFDEFDALYAKANKTE